MFKLVEDASKKFLQEVKDKKIEIITHYDTDGITSGAIFASKK